ncbi:hypothetical protein ACMAZD_05680 [Vibrio sp. nBUS_14]|uniref:hypothetical protein n=1 Tax=Vibrio sp. nBUS_14 TaxID=3395321 RepID=UPI003EC11697
MLKRLLKKINSIESGVEFTKLFIAPQLSYIDKTFPRQALLSKTPEHINHNYTIHSLAYILALVNISAKRPLKDEEIVDTLIAVTGKETIVRHRLKFYSLDEFKRGSGIFYDVAKNDIMRGVVNGSNTLAEIAKVREEIDLKGIKSLFDWAIRNNIPCSVIPRKITDLVLMDGLDLGSLNIQEVPYGIQFMPYLESLHLYDNCISELPEFLFDISLNSFREVRGLNSRLVYEIDKIGHFTYLDVRGNRLESLPAGISRLIFLDPYNVYQ